MTAVENIDFILKIIAENNVNIIINEDGLGSALDLFSHPIIPKNIKIISHLHFDPESAIGTFYSTLNLPIIGERPLTSIVNILKWLKAPYNKYTAIKTREQRIKKLLDGSDNVVVLSPNYINPISRITDKNLANKIIAIENPLSYTAHQYHGNNKINEIIFVGRLTYTQKRVDRVLKVWNLLNKEFPDWSLSIIGDGEDRHRLERLSNKLKLERINFVGQQDPQPYYKRAKILLLTSNYEGTPMVIPEAMSFGVIPVVMNSFSAVTDIINDGCNGILTDAFDIKKMASQIIYIINDSHLMEKLSQNALATIQNMDSNYSLSKWNKLLLNENATNIQ